jgi:o-succinylbenzoate---CoA ligase
MHHLLWRPELSQTSPRSIRRLFLDPLRDAARRDPQGEAVVLPEGAGWSRPGHWSFQMLDQRVDEAALRLSAQGVGLGDSVALLLPPSPEALVLLFALPRVGAILVPLHPSWTLPEIERALGALGGVSLVLAPEARLGELESGLSLPPGMRRPALEAVEAILDEEGTPLPFASGRPADLYLESETPIALILTSGSTGAPRPIPLTHGNLMASTAGAVDRLRLDPADRWLASLAVAHVGGLVLLHRAVVVGSALVFLPRLEPELLLDLADRGEITHASLVPVVLERLLAARGGRPAPRGLRCLLLGGTATPAPLLDRALAGRWPVALTYGLTEATSQVATATPEETRSKPGSVGRPLRGVSVRLSEGDRGEILVGGATVALLGSPPEGAPRPASGVFVDAEGWLHTGDLGSRDSEGDLRIVGRVSDRIVSGGTTVEPGEVEAVLLRAPGVAEVVVLGTPDPTWGERIVALVVPSDPESPPDPEALLTFARGELASSRRPREVHVVSALPRNANGKVDRGAARVLMRLRRGEP